MRLALGELLFVLGIAHSSSISHLVGVTTILNEQYKERHSENHIAPVNIEETVIEVTPEMVVRIGV
jgi:hypothetical protein